MDLRTFITKTLVDIANGVADAQRDPVGKIARFNPGTKGSGTELNVQPDGRWQIQNVEFDVAVTVAESSGKDGGGGVNVAAIFSFGGKVESASSREAFSRIRFSLPVALPRPAN